MMRRLFDRTLEKLQILFGSSRITVLLHFMMKYGNPRRTFFFVLILFVTAIFTMPILFASCGCGDDDDDDDTQESDDDAELLDKGPGFIRGSQDARKSYRLIGMIGNFDAPFFTTAGFH